MPKNNPVPKVGSSYFEHPAPKVGTKTTRSSTPAPPAPSKTVLTVTAKKYQHSFSACYNTDKLVWFQKFDWIGDALTREKQIKAGSRKKKLDLINAMNPDWRDLYDDLTE